jgi:hypothetical protein
VKIRLYARRARLALIQGVGPSIGATRTISLHNPLVYKAKIVGDWTINGSEPPYVWQIGAGPSRESKSLS